MEKNADYFEIWVRIDAIQDETNRLRNLVKGGGLEEEAKARLLTGLASELAYLYESMGLSSDGKPMVADKAGPKVGEDFVDMSKHETRQAAASSPKFSMRLLH